MSNQDNNDPRHNPVEADRLIREAYKRGKQLTRHEGIKFSARRHYDPLGLLPVEWSGRGRKPTKTRAQHSADRRRGLYHNLVRLPGIRQKLADAREKYPKHFNRGRCVVFPLIEQAIAQGTPERLLRGAVKRLGVGLDWFPSERRLSDLIREFRKVNAAT